MQQTTAFVPLRLADKPLLMRAVAVALGTLFLAASSYVEVPMLPVPMTMQTFAITLVGALYGWRLGAATVVAWLVEGALGLPVLAGGAGGLAHFAGPTAGYLFAFPVAAALCGWLAERGWTAPRYLSAFGSMAAGNLLILTVGTAWLTIQFGLTNALEWGFTPFIIGGLLKSALAVACIEALRRGKAAL